jgi:hypothetical protein
VLNLGKDFRAIGRDALMLKEGVVVEEGDLIDYGLVVLAYANEHPKSKVSSDGGD